MPASKAQRQATDKYISEKTDELKIRVAKGRKAVLQAHAEKADGGSVNKFVNRAIDNQIDRDKAGDANAQT